MKSGYVTDFIKKNFLLIAVGIASVVLLLFLSETFGGTDEKNGISNSDSLESRVEEFLSSLCGVGECNVMIFFENEKTSSFSSVETEKISGIAVICAGGGDSTVKSTITDVLTRLFGLSGSRISINEIK